MAKVSFALLACLLLLFVIAISEVEAADQPKQCNHPSKTYKGPCGEKDTAKCGDACKKENASNMNGNCRKDGTCLCFFVCAKGPPSVHTKPARPGSVQTSSQHSKQPFGDGGKPTIKPAVTTTRK